MDDGVALRESIARVVTGHPVVFSYVFGSIARGEASDTSDVDVAVRFEPDLARRERFDLLLHLGVALERALGREVDLVDLDEAPLRLAGRILTERVVVTGLDRPERVAYETELFPQYIDFEFHARQMDTEMLRAMAAGDR